MEVYSMSTTDGARFPYRSSALVAPIYHLPQAEEDFNATTVPEDEMMEAKSAAAAASALRSCTTCSKAKAKCVRAPGQGICERCSRLKKECHSREPVLRRRKVVKTTRAAQLEKLENKIEHLVNALATTQSQRGFSIDLGQPSPPISQTSEKQYNDHRIIDDAQNARQQAVLNSLCDAIDESEETTPNVLSPRSPNNRSSSNTQVSSPVAQYADYCSVGVPLQEAEILLDRYRRLMSPAMPFVVLPPGATAHSLFNEKPTLLHAIVVVASFHDLAKQQINVKRLLRNLSERIMINCEKSIDILQAILVFVGWYHPHIFWSQQCTNLLHLAIALVIDLGFDRSPQQCGDFKKSTHRAEMPSMVERTPLPEEHRILAGVFYLTSTLSSSFKKIDAMPWTDYLANCLQTLEANAEYDSDAFLVQIVRLQHLIEESSTLGTPQGPMQMYIKAFTADLTALRKSDPCIKTSEDANTTTTSNAMNNTNMLLQLQYLTTEILIWELSLNDLQENRTVPLRARIADLCHLVDAIKTFLDLYFTLPVASYLTMPFSVCAQFAHAFVVLIKIASLELDGWDFRMLSARLDFLAVVEEAAVRFEQTVTAKPDGLEVSNDHFGKWAIRIRWMKQVYEAKFVVNPGDDRGDDTLRAMFRPPGADEGYGGSATSASAAETPASTVGGVGGQQQQQQPTPPDDVLSGDFFNYLDENFWNSFAGDFDLGYPEVSMV